MPPFQSIEYKSDVRENANAGEVAMDLKVLRKGVGGGILALNRTQEVPSDLSHKSITHYESVNA